MVTTKERELLLLSLNKKEMDFKTGLQLMISRVYKFIKNH